MKKILLSILFCSVFSLFYAQGKKANTISCPLNADSGNSDYTYLKIKFDKNDKASKAFSSDSTLEFQRREGKIFFINADGSEKECKQKDILTIPVEQGGHKFDYKLLVRNIKPDHIALASRTTLDAEYKNNKMKLWDKNTNGIFGESGKDQLSVNGSPLLPFGS